MLSRGWRPQGRGRGSFLVRHSCDFRPCCNPAHLLEGTQADNMADCIQRGRHSPPPRFEGEGHPRAKLTARKVRVARRAHRMGFGCAVLARRYGVGDTTMGHVLAGRTWRHA